MSDKVIMSEAVEALAAQKPTRFPREMLLVIIVLAVLWEILSWLVPPYVIPGWGRIFTSLAQLRVDFVVITLLRVAAALFISFVLGLALAVAMYRWTAVENYVRPAVRLLMAVPVVCWILFSVL